ncbi:hypothetical protein QP866_06660 [Corynebacterium imitans]|uniref:hypothetical protein n=1 Tax=Corynebacterium imitans TaxID=156978 RepID=UPI00254E1ADD|nr:hypothetical protein [Corynebacterium imitans]MDK8637507.1 hypothetical protein [Corynebacterium imitans]MDK8772069.1 hypothetical protein [Corynebacterium imitans]
MTRDELDTSMAEAVGVLAIDDEDERDCAPLTALDVLGALLGTIAVYVLFVLAAMVDGGALWS